MVLRLLVEVAVLLLEIGLLVAVLVSHWALSVLASALLLVLLGLPLPSIREATDARSAD